MKFVFENEVWKDKVFAFRPTAFSVYDGIIEAKVYLTRSLKGLNQKRISPDSVQFQPFIAVFLIPFDFK